MHDHTHVWWLDCVVRRVNKPPPPLSPHSPLPQLNPLCQHGVQECLSSTSVTASKHNPRSVFFCIFRVCSPNQGLLSPRLCAEKCSKTYTCCVWRVCCVHSRAKCVALFLLCFFLRTECREALLASKKNCSTNFIIPLAAPRSSTTGPPYGEEGPRVTATCVRWENMYAMKDSCGVAKDTVAQ
jgi:hypothetical protein